MPRFPGIERAVAVLKEEHGDLYASMVDVAAQLVVMQAGVRGLEELGQIDKQFQLAKMLGDSVLCLRDGIKRGFPGKDVPRDIATIARGFMNDMEDN